MQVDCQLAQEREKGLIRGEIHNQKRNKLF